MFWIRGGFAQLPLPLDMALFTKVCSTYSLFCRDFREEGNVEAWVTEQSQTWLFFQRWNILPVEDLLTVNFYLCNFLSFDNFLFSMHKNCFSKNCWIYYDMPKFLILKTQAIVVDIPTWQNFPSLLTNTFSVHRPKKAKK